MAEIFKNILPKEFHESLSAGEIRELREKEEATSGIFMGLIFFGFIWAVILISMILWMNKFTLFIFLISSLWMAFLIALGVFNYKVYKKMLKVIIDRGVE